MKQWKKLWLARLILVTACASIGWPQQATQQIDISQRGLEQAKQTTEHDPDLDEETRAAVLKLYDEALGAVASAESFAAQAASHRRDQDSIPRRVQSLEAELQTAATAPEVTVPDSATAAEVQQIVRQATAELAARREAVRDLQRRRDQRADRRSGIIRQVAVLNQEVYDLGSSIESTAESARRPQERAAILASLAARRRAAQEQIRSLNAELEGFAVRGPLRLLREQQAERRVVESVQRLSLLDEILQARVAAETEANLAQLRQDAESALEQYPNLNVLTDQILGYASDLFGPEGIQKKVEPVGAALNAVRDANRRTAQVMQVARTKYEALGSRADLQRWWPNLPSEIPSRPRLRLEIQQRNIDIADARATLVSLQDRQANQPALDSELAALLTSLRPATDESEAAQQQAICRQLLATRARLLERLISEYRDYSTGLTDLNTLSEELLNELEAGYEFTLERVYWRRSIAGPLIPATSDIRGAAGWLFGNPEWPATVSRSLEDALGRPVMWVGGLAIVVLLFVRRRKFEERLLRAGELTAESEKPVRPLVESFLMTFLLAIPGPLLMAGVGFFLLWPEPAMVAEYVGIALIAAAAGAVSLELIVQFFRPGGVAEIQFGWHATESRKIQREIRYLMFVLVPSGLLCTAFGQEASDHVGIPTRVAYVESLGRIAFIVSALAIAITSFRLLRWLAWQKKNALRPLQRLLFSVLGITSLVSVFLACAGWYLTGFILLLLVFRSFFLALFVGLAMAFLDRSRLLREKRLLEIQTAEQADLEAKGGAGRPDLEAEDKKIDVVAANRRVREVIRIVGAIVLFIGIFSIWSAQIPSLRLLNRIQILPTVRILPSEEVIPADVVVAAEAAAPQTAPSQLATPLEALVPSGAPSGSQERASAEWSLTLGGLLMAILIAVATTLVAKYIPSLFDFAILSRFRISSGDRTAITTIVSYVLVIIGISAAATKIGLQWSQIQWLAAAFSFGLGFGLQDIFANFFSGLTLLFERPMKVGDFCKFGEQIGTVESIGLRSTRVRGTDRTLINVPNADFSKKELVNFAARDRYLLRTTIGLRYETTPEQMRYVLAKIRELFLSHPKITEEPARARFVGYGAHSLNIDIFAYGLAKDWGEFLGVQEDVLLRIMKIVLESGTGFAFPSQTLYLARDHGNDPEKTAAAEAEVQTWKDEYRLPFPDFARWQRRKLLNEELDYPPTGSPHAKYRSDEKDAE